MTAIQPGRRNRVDEEVLEHWKRRCEARRKQGYRNVPVPVRHMEQIIELAESTLNAEALMR